MYSNLSKICVIYLHVALWCACRIKYAVYITLRMFRYGQLSTLIIYPLDWTRGTISTRALSSCYHEPGQHFSDLFYDLAPFTPFSLSFSWPLDYISNHHNKNISTTINTHKTMQL